MSASPTAGVQEVFDHWRLVMNTPRSVLDKKRRRNVEARLRDGYDVADLKAAIDGCAQTPHNMGENDRGERYDDLELICRDAAHVERFIHNAQAPPKPKQAGYPDVNGGIIRGAT